MAGMTPEQVRDLLNSKDNYAAHCGMVISEAGPGTAVAEMKVGKQHLNSVGTVHGGVLFTLADFAFACACNTYGTVSVSIGSSITIHRPGTEGTLIARAREQQRSRTLGTYIVEVFDQQEKLVATFTGLCFNKPDSLKQFVV